MNGYDVAQRIKEMPQPPRLVAVSGYAQREDQERSAAAGSLRICQTRASPR